MGEDTTELRLPDPDAVRSAIKVADERVRLLRRLLRLLLQLEAVGDGDRTSTLGRK